MRKICKIIVTRLIGVLKILRMKKPATMWLRVVLFV